MKNLILPFVLLLTLVFSCRESDVDEGLEKTASYDVYISGKDNGDLCYWKNNVKHSLNYNLSPEEAPTKLFVDNNDVYVKGRYGFWKNGNYTTYRQASNSPSQFALDIFDFHVNNGEIYFVGYTWSNISSSTPAEFCYWKNGSKNILFTSTTAHNDFATITVFNSDVYIGANKDIGNVITGGYFKNSVFYPLSNATSFPQHTFVVSNDNQVYFSSIFFYKNLITGIETPITPTTYTRNYKPALDLNDVYINGGMDSYYKNSTYIYTANLSKPIIVDLKVKDENIYMIRMDPNNIEYKVYINNIETQSIQNLNFNSSFNNITVVKL
ncbi:hypothetical protein IX39_06005 [Chryseobacterium formosense]|uniref:DUF5050 domain-containing protein n=1 Tax=Chryseobacterium formosense TaxID=236814 RepID=A0A085Z6Z6_9FLAO|nr:hypothetical protein [Chryseobacterium formosense]KFF00210.1 hypothetical protein IX39_06005 [Chryseobacterium formosense]SFT63144.1 hypothetical protein SAMN05421857_2288 [Chryseobacterium formosense]